MLSVLEDLPNELLLFIFNHLSFLDVLWSFYRLNRRFSSLLRTITHVHVDFSAHSLSKTRFIDILNQLRPFKIHSIRISPRYYVDVVPLFVSYIPPSQLIDLRSLALIDADRTTIEKFLYHRYPQLTSLSIESPCWRSIPQHCLPHFSKLTHCGLPSLTFLHACHSQITHLRLDHCTTDDLLHLNTLVPNLHSLTLALNQSTTIPSELQLPACLMSLTLILRSVLFSEFERLVVLTEHLKNLTVSFSNTEHEVYRFDQYLFGENWSSINNYVDNLRFNIIVHQTSEAFEISELVSAFHGFDKPVNCQAIEDTNGYHLFSLPFIDGIYRINTVDYLQDTSSSDGFSRVRHLHLTVPNQAMQEFPLISSDCPYKDLQTLTVVTPVAHPRLMSFVDTLMIDAPLRTLELRFTSLSSNCREGFDKLIFHLPPSIEMLILNTASTRFLFDLLDRHPQLLSELKRLLCSVKDRDEFDSLILLLLEIFQQKALIYMSISLENASKSPNLLAGWLLKTSYLRRARIKCSDRQCTIWV